MLPTTTWLSAERRLFKTQEDALVGQTLPVVTLPRPLAGLECTGLLHVLWFPHALLNYSHVLDWLCHLEEVSAQWCRYCLMRGTMQDGGPASLRNGWPRSSWAVALWEGSRTSIRSRNPRSTEEICKDTETLFSGWTGKYRPVNLLSNSNPIHPVTSKEGDITQHNHKVCPYHVTILNNRDK